MRQIKVNYQGKIKKIEIGKYENALEIGDNFDNDDFDYTNIPHETVPDLIRELIRLYPDWDK